MSADEARELGGLLAQLDAYASEAGDRESAPGVDPGVLQNVVRKGEELLARLGNDDA
jgi:hypothetical protein